MKGDEDKWENTKEKVRGKSNWKPRQKGPKNGPAYLFKDESSCPLCVQTWSANCRGQKPWSGLKYTLNKLSVGTERDKKAETQSGSAGVTEEDKGGPEKRWTHKYDEK